MSQSTELIERLSGILRDEVCPALRLDCSAIEVVSVTDGVAKVRLGSLCAACPSTLMTVIHGLEQELRRQFPEIKYLEALP